MTVEAAAARSRSNSSCTKEEDERKEPEPSPTPTLTLDSPDETTITLTANVSTLHLTNDSTSSGNERIKKNVIVADVAKERNTTSTTSLCHQIGLTGACRKLTVKEESLQERLDQKMGDLRKLLNTDDPIDAFLQNGQDGVSSIHTIVIYRKDGTVKRYDILKRSHFEALLNSTGRAGGLERKQQEFLRIAKELNDISEEIAPRGERCAQYSPGRVGNLLGAHPFAHVSKSIGGLLSDYNYYMKKVIVKAMKDSDMKMVKKDGTLNEYGKRALKEMVVAYCCIKRDKASKTLLLKHLKKRRKEQKSREEVKQINNKISKTEKRLEQLKELDQAKFAIFWMIMQLNRPYEFHLKNGRKETMTVRQAIVPQGPHRELYFDPAKKNKFDPTSLRKQMAKQSSLDFKNVWCSRRTLKKEEKQIGVELGAMFFYGGDARSTDSYRILNMIYHEKSKMRLTRDIPLVGWVINKAHNIVKEKRDRLNPQSEGKKRGVKEWVEMTPEAALEFIRDQGIMGHDDRNSARKWVSDKYHRFVKRGWEKKKG